MGGGYAIDGVLRMLWMPLMWTSVAWSNFVLEELRDRESSRRGSPSVENGAGRSVGRVLGGELDGDHKHLLLNHFGRYPPRSQVISSFELVVGHSVVGGIYVPVVDCE